MGTNKREYELYHYGVKGMKWGVRRYQNKDGSLTPKGKKRYTGDDTINSAKRLADGDLDGAKQYLALMDEYRRRKQELDDSGIDDEDAYWDKVDELTEKYIKPSWDYAERMDDDKARLRKAVLTSDLVKSQMDQAKSIKKDMITLDRKSATYYDQYSKLERKYFGVVANIGETVTGSYANEPISVLTSTYDSGDYANYGDWAASMVDSYINNYVWGYED